MSAFTRRQHDDRLTGSETPVPDRDTTSTSEGNWWLLGHAAQPGNDDLFTPSAFGM